MKIQNPSWVALTVIVIDQNSLGASVKKAWYRLLGTALGVIAGILFGAFFVCALSAIPVVGLTDGFSNISIRSR